jgi:hypothetical protein
MLRITGALALDGFWVELTLSDGSRVERDVGDLLRGQVFDAIRTDPARFRELRARRGTLEWPGDVDLDGAVLIWDGPRPRSRSSRPSRVSCCTIPRRRR